MLVPVEVTVLRSGIPDTLPGRALNLSERGMAVVLAGELKKGESVGVEFRLPSMAEPMRTRAAVRHQDSLLYGFEFTAISAQQRNAIRSWAKGVKAGAKAADDTASPLKTARDQEAGASRGTVPRADSGSRKTKLELSWRAWLVAVGVLLIVAAGGWWQWNRSWERIEAGLKGSQPVSGDKPQAQVPPEVMQKLLLHRVDPVYPPEARKQHLQGIIAVNVVVGRDGSIISMRPLNGPEILARAAMDSLRWWKFEAYRLNGEPAVVETTLAVEFKR